ncbi:MAG: DUF1343 domain-containing protein [Methylacidiphilales bacterium]|nr:DUF1343 domain-containing protein [Candidatus Methylacidiphilales bacterium]
MRSFLLFTLILTENFSSAHSNSNRVVLGIDVLASNQFRGLEGKKVGLITNQSGVNELGISTVDILRQAPQVNLVALFAPEHGIYGAEPAGEYVPTLKDEYTGLTVYSLYGPTRKPTPEMLRGIDVLVFDIQDIGSRSYTYISTLGLAMEAAGEAGIEFYVLDRPNPLGGNRIEGPLLDPQFRSFVGQWEIPYVHGLTIGELAKMIIGEKWIEASPSLTVVPMHNWKREMIWHDTGLVWVPTSPHIPSPESAFFYAMTGLVGEHGRISHGIGYTLPFQILGLPRLDAYRFARNLNDRQLPGVRFRPAFFRPFYGALRGQLCSGAQPHIVDFRKVNCFDTGIHILDAIAQTFGAKSFEKRNPKHLQMFDLICGTDRIRIHFASGKGAKELIESYTPDIEKFRRQRAPYLIY